MSGSLYPGIGGSLYPGILSIPKNPVNPDSKPSVRDKFYL
jgi:hypothetical protein